MINYWLIKWLKNIDRPTMLHIIYCMASALQWRPCLSWAGRWWLWLELHVVSASHSNLHCCWFWPLHLAPWPWAQTLHLCMWWFHPVQLVLVVLFHSATGTDTLLAHVVVAPSATCAGDVFPAIVLAQRPNLHLQWHRSLWPNINESCTHASIHTHEHTHTQHPTHNTHKHLHNTQICTHTPYPTHKNKNGAHPNILCN